MFFLARQFLGRRNACSPLVFKAGHRWWWTVLLDTGLGKRTGRSNDVLELRALKWPVLFPLHSTDTLGSSGRCKDLSEVVSRRGTPIHYNTKVASRSDDVHTCSKRPRQISFRLLFETSRRFHEDLVRVPPILQDIFPSLKYQNNYFRLRTAESNMIYLCVSCIIQFRCGSGNMPTTKTEVQTNKNVFVLPTKHDKLLCSFFANFFFDHCSHIPCYSRIHFMKEN